MKKFKVLISVLLMLVMMMNFSCTQKEEDPKAPELPPEASMVMNYNAFSEADTAATKGYANWGYSALNVLVWNTVLTVNLVVPVAAFYESFNHQPSYLGEFEWLWSYTVQVGAQEYQASLYGQIVNTNVEWKMYISKTGQYDNFLWYEGVVNSQNTQANWTMYRSPTNPEEFLTISYLDDVGNGVESLRYTKVEELVGTQASYIEYGNITEATHDRYYTIFLQDQDKLTEIEWNSVYSYGRVKDEIHFGDVDWHCWDEDLLDVICP